RVSCSRKPDCTPSTTSSRWTTRSRPTRSPPCAPSCTASCPRSTRTGSAMPETKPLRFAIAIPQFVADGAFDPAGFRAYLARGERLGFESAWTQEQVVGHAMPLLNPIPAMTYAAACTERLRLGCAVFVTPLHSPVHLAKSLSTLDQLSRGRLEVGVGTGGRG